MQHRIRNFTLAILAVLALSPGLFAQTTRPSGGTTAQPDLSGIWQEEINPRAVPPGVFTKEEPPMLPWAIEKSRIRSRGTRQEVDDPSFYPYCMPRTFPRVYNFDPSIEILQTPNRIYMIFEHDHQVRRIFLDGKKHLEGWGRTWMGNLLWPLGRRHAHRGDGQYTQSERTRLVRSGRASLYRRSAGDRTHPAPDPGNLAD